MSQRLLSSLKVAELRTELEKRSLDKSGVKQTLVDRLREYLINEGHDPSEYNFDEPPNVDPQPDQTLTETIKIEPDTDTYDAFDETNRPGTQLTAISDESMGAAEHSVDEEEAASEQNSEPKKPLEEAAPFVVSVGENEEDLDYDLKDAKQTVSGETASTTTTSRDKQASSSNESVSKQQQHDKVGSSGGGRTSKTSTSVEQSNLRVSNLTMPTRAVDLKQLFSAHGKVLSAKILASTRSPGGCVGFLKMASGEDAASCILNLDGTEFNGNTIKIEATDEVPVAQSSAPKMPKPPLGDDSRSTPTKAFRKAPPLRDGRATLSRNNTNTIKQPVLNARRTADFVGRYKKSALLQSRLTRTLNRARYMARAMTSVVQSTAAGKRSFIQPRREAVPRRLVEVGGRRTENMYQGARGRLQPSSSRVSCNRRYPVPYTAFKLPVAYKRPFESELQRQQRIPRWNTAENRFEEDNARKSYTQLVGRRSDPYVFKKSAPPPPPMANLSSVRAPHSSRLSYGGRSSNGRPYEGEESPGRRYIKPVVYRRSLPDGHESSPPPRNLTGGRRGGSSLQQPYEKQKNRYDLPGRGIVDRRRSEHFSPEYMKTVRNRQSPSVSRVNRPIERVDRLSSAVQQSWRNPVSAVPTHSSRARYSSTSGRSRSPLASRRSLPKVPPPVRYTRPQRSPPPSSTNNTWQPRHHPFSSPTQAPSYNHNNNNNRSRIGRRGGSHSRPNIAGLMGSPPNPTSAAYHRHGYNRNSSSAGGGFGAASTPTTSTAASATNNSASGRPPTATETYSRRSTGVDMASHRSPQKPSSSVIDYGHRSGGSKSFGNNWQSSSSQSQGHGNSFSSSHWRSQQSGSNSSNSRPSHY